MYYKNYFNLIIIAIPKRINKIPITISKIFKILFNPKSASGKEERALTFALVPPDVEEVVPKLELVVDNVFVLEYVVELSVEFDKLLVDVSNVLLFKFKSTAKLGNVNTNNSKTIIKNNLIFFDI